MKKIFLLIPGVLLGLLLSVLSPSSVLAGPEAEVEITVTAAPAFLIVGGAIILILLFVFISSADRYLGGKE